ncbi:MAG: helix-turn-helix transcriptional regulator [Verrucomicrobia bacterium]|nr:helix-turn-helix transcriptional regulator [Verrucomicrobiota bacterium]
MQILKPRGPLAGFWAVGLDRILSEVIDSGELWEEPKYRIGPHLHRHWEIGYIVEGTTRIGAMGGREFILKPGSLWCFPPSVNHWLEHGPEPKHHQLWVGFDLRAAENRHPNWKALQTLRRISSMDGLAHLEKHFRHVIREGTTSSTHQAAGLQLALDALVLEVLRAMESPGPSRSPVALHPAVSRALSIVDGRFREDWNLTKLAEEVGLSRGRLAVLFSREVGCSMHKLLTKVRIRHAEVLLVNSDLPIGDVALDCGFATIQHFSRVFKQMTGQTPIEFRRRSPSMKPVA